MKKKHNILYLADMRTTIASNNKNDFKSAKLLFSDLTRLWQNHYAKISTIFGLGNILFSYLCCCCLTLKVHP